MNLKQIWCSIKTLGKHSKFHKLDNGDSYCLNCDRYQWSYYNAIASRKAMRNSWKFWWETPE